jgi:hypothetical protein
MRARRHTDKSRGDILGMGGLGGELDMHRV